MGEVSLGMPASVNGFVGGCVDHDGGIDSHCQSM